MLIDTQAIVLKATRYSDTNSIVHTYTEQFGSTSYLVSRSSSRKSGGLRAMFLPLSIVNITTDHRPNKEIQRAKEVSILHLPTRPSVDPIANAIALFIAELLDKILRFIHFDSELFSFVAEEIRRMDSMDDRGMASFHLYFLGGLTWRLGIIPDTEDYRQGDILCCEEGRFRPPVGRHEAEWVEGAYYFHKILTTPSIESVEINRQGRNKTLKLILHYLDHHFSGLSQLKSPEVLQELFV